MFEDSLKIAGTPPRRHCALFAAATLGTLAIASTAMATTDASAWQIGPIIKGRNYSVGMPLNPTPTRDGMAIDFPYPSEAAGHVHYVTFNPGSLTGKSRIVMRYRVEAARGVRFVPRQFPDRVAGVTLFIQRRGDTWTARGRYETYRWYAPPASIQALAPGSYEMSVPLDDPEWNAVMTTRARDDRAGFADALENAGRVGFVFGSDGGRGHGVFATGPARLTVTQFEIR